MPTPPKVLYVAFDACDHEIVRELAAAGELPTFQHLLDHAAVAPVDPPLAVYISANWPSFSTALAPDRHDYLCWVDVDPETYAWEETGATVVKGTPFWHRLSNDGHRVAMFDIPHALCDPESDAVQVFEWGCHDRHAGPSSSPPDLLGRLDAAAGTHPIGGMPAQRPLNFAPCDFAHRAGLHRTVSESVALWQDLLIGVDRKRAASLQLLAEDDWSLFAVVFGESHCVGHQLWAAHDPEHPRHDPTLVALIGDPVREMYRRLDAVLADHLARAGDDTTVYVHLSHGMGPHYDGTHLLDVILRRFHEADVVERGWRTRAARAAVGRVPAHLQARLVGTAAAQIRRRADQRPPAPNEPWELPLAERQWFQVPNNALGAIRVNLRGREANGMVAPSDYDRVCDDLARWLTEIVNVDTGEPLVHRVARTDAHYRRRAGDRFPDLFIEWNSNAPIERVYSPRIGVVAGHDPQWRTGDHRRHGLLFARGPGIVPGVRPDPIPIMAVGPTMCAALGVELNGVDGAPVLDLVPAPFGRPAATRREAAWPRPTTASTRPHGDAVGRRASRHPTARRARRRT